VQDLVGFLPIVAIFLVFYLLAIRPQQRRAKETMAMQRSLDVGDEVMLTSGVYGTLVEVGDDTVLLAIADQVTIKVARAAVGRVTQAEEPAENPAAPEES
jgi:preprotein translocase subunit YajC